MTLRTVTGVVAVAVADAIRDEIDKLGAAAIAPGLAAIALDLAAAIDSTDAPTSKAVVARELSGLMVKLRALANPTAGRGTVDELKRKRAARRERAQRAAP